MTPNETSRYPHYGAAVTKTNMGIRVIAVLIILLIMTGCASIEIKETRTRSTGIQAGEGVTLLLDYAGGKPAEAEELEKKLGQCVAESLVDYVPSARFIDAQAFRKMAFARLDITAAPRRTASLLLLLNRLEFQRVIKTLGLRYVVSVAESTDKTWRKEIGGAGAGAGTFAVLSSIENKKTELIARVIDLEKAVESGRVESRVEDTGAYGMIAFGVLPLPVIVPATTEASACKNLGKAVAEFIRGNGAIKPAPPADPRPRDAH